MATFLKRSTTSIAKAPPSCFFQPALYPASTSSAVFRHPHPIPFTPCRHINRSAGATGLNAPPVTAFNDPAHPLDEKIGTRMVHLVDSNEEMHEPQSLALLLRTLDRETEHIQQVGMHAETDVPVVKIRTKRSLRDAAHLKDAQKKAQNKAQSAGKELELTWSIERNHDLEHRLRKMEGWLTEGKTVEIMIGQKKGGRRASTEEAEELIKLLRDRAFSINGVRETAAIEGHVGGQAVIKFASKSKGNEGQSVAQTLRKDRQEKMKKKEEEKARKRQEAEDKRSRAEAREKERMRALRERASAG